MFAYIDESGNTGLNLFDPGQPHFFHVAMSSPVDFDTVFQERVARIAHHSGADYLHASELGQLGVEEVSPRLKDLVEFSQVRFHFAYAEKPDVAVIKFYDAVFDSGENPAADRLNYGARLLRLGLLLHFANLLELDDVKLFWKAMTKRRTQETEKAAIKAIDNVLCRVGELQDARVRELISDTLFWARNNVGRLSFWSSKKSERFAHLPNIFTLPQLFDGIHKSAGIWESDVEKIIHDQQDQFKGTLRQWHSFLRDLDPEPIYHFGDTPIQFADISKSQFELSESRLSAGLQVVDVILWIFSRLVSGRTLGPSACDLFQDCFSTDSFYFLSLDSIADEVDLLESNLMNQSLSEDQLRRGKDIVERLERERQRRIREFVSGNIAQMKS